MGRHLSVEEKVGQLMMFGFQGQTIPQYIRDFIIQHNLGGIIHFSRNISNPEQIKALNKELQELAKQSPSGEELLISLDQEGGSVVRLTEGVSVSPGNMATGATKDPTWAEKSAAVMGQELRAVGFNVNLAPCVDVNNNPKNPVIGVRSYGSNPKLVGEMGQGAIRGFQNHLIAVAKHFPGHGDTHMDSHLSLPTIGHERERLDAIELPPFKDAIACGVQGILAAHVLFPALEDNPKLPATLSHKILTGLLREELGFQGLIFTDCMEMDAISELYSMGDAAVLAIQAGVDVVLVSHTHEKQEEAYWAVVKAVESGKISMERIDQSLARIAQAKKFLASLGKVSTFAANDHAQVMTDLMAHSLTVVQDRGNLPLQTNDLFVIETVAQATSVAEEKIIEKRGLSEQLREVGFKVEQAKVGLTCQAEEIKKLAAEATNHDLVLLVTQDAHRYEGQADLVREIMAVKQELIVIGTRTPYELKEFREVPTYIASYSNRSIVWQPIVDLLTGTITAQGRLPVELS